MASIDTPEIWLAMLRFTATGGVTDQTRHEPRRGHQGQAAALLGISRKGLWEKRKRYGIP